MNRLCWGVGHEVPAPHLVRREAMEPIKSIVLDHRGERIELLAGISTGPGELNAIKDLIQREYQRRHYIPESLSSFDDQYEDISTYFGTYANQELLAGARIIHSAFLPTARDFYRLDVPAPVQRCPTNKIREVSRLTVLKRPGRNPLPRHLTSTIMISALIDYGFKSGLCGGISTIKVSFLRLFEQLKLYVFHEIPGAELVYPRDGILGGFFYDEENPAVPIYYLHDESKAIFDGLFHSIQRTGKTLLDEPVKVLSYKVLV
jgi:hypothetical protein